MAQLVKNPPAVWKTWVRSLGWEDPLAKGKAAHPSILAWRSPWGHKESDTTEQLSLSLFTFMMCSNKDPAQSKNKWFNKKTTCKNYCWKVAECLDPHSFMDVFKNIANFISCETPPFCSLLFLVPCWEWSLNITPVCHELLECSKGLAKNSPGQLTSSQWLCALQLQLPCD